MLGLIFTDPGFTLDRAMLCRDLMLDTRPRRFIRAPMWRRARCTTGIGIREATLDAATSTAIAGKRESEHDLEERAVRGAGPGYERPELSQVKSGSEFEFK